MGWNSYFVNNISHHSLKINVFICLPYIDTVFECVKLLIYQSDYLYRMVST